MKAKFIGKAKQPVTVAVPTPPTKPTNPKQMYGIKFTNAKGQTGRGYKTFPMLQWKIGAVHTVRGRKNMTDLALCTNRVIHFYPIKGTTPTTSEMRRAKKADRNLHAEYTEGHYRAYLVIASGQIVTDDNKAGATRVRAVKCLIKNGQPYRWR